MTLAAFSGLERGVDIGLAEADLVLGVALQTDLVAILFQEQFGHPAVTEVAALALLLLDDRMQIFHGEIFVRKLGVTIHTFLGGELLWRGLDVSSDSVQDCAAEQHDQRQNSDSYISWHTH